MNYDDLLEAARYHERKAEWLGATPALALDGTTDEPAADWHRRIAQGLRDCAQAMRAALAGVDRDTD